MIKAPSTHTLSLPPPPWGPGVFGGDWHIYLQWTTKTEEMFAIKSVSSTLSLSLTVTYDPFISESVRHWDHCVSARRDADMSHCVFINVNGWCVCVLVCTSICWCVFAEYLLYWWKPLFLSINPLLVLQQIPFWK